MYKSRFKIEEPSEVYVLREKLYSIQSDVDTIYNMYFKDIVNEVQKKEQIKSIQRYKKISTSSLSFIVPGDIMFDVISSNILKSKDCKKAHKEKSINIYIGVFEAGNFYDFKEKYIVLSLHKQIVDVLISGGYDLLDGSEAHLKRAYNEITEHRIKATIAHELSHWIDDALYNVFVKITKNKLGISAQEALLLKQKNINMTYFEINAQIHGIKQIQKKYKNKYDTFDLNDLFNLYTSLHNIALNIYVKFGVSVFNIWIKYLMKRMARENLLGKNMKSGVSTDKLREKVASRI